MCTLVGYPVMFSCCDKLKESQSIEYIQYIPMQCLTCVVLSRLSSCVPLAGGSGFNCRQFMEKYKDKFLQFVDSRAISIRLLMEGIIPPYLSHQLQNVDSTTGAQLLFLHLQEQANRDSLLKLCNVIINLTGYPNMSSLGRDMKRDLEQPVNTSTS